jgi:hypothetical protein
MTARSSMAAPRGTSVARRDGQLTSRFIPQQDSTKRPAADAGMALVVRSRTPASQV